MSKFMLLIHSDSKKWADLGETEQKEILGEYFAYTQALVDAGAMVSGDPLEPASAAKSVAQGGVVTDGPFADTSEVLGGYYVVDVPDIDAACEWAAKIPAVPRGLSRIEVWPVRALPDMQ